MRHAFCAALAAAMVTLPAAGIAETAFQLSGAWATDPDNCGKIFAKKGNAVVFSDASDLYGSGFIVDGKKIVGKSGRCTIDTMKDDGSTINLLASCASEIMYQNIQFSLKITTADAIVRMFPGLPDIAISFYRCPVR